MIVFRPGKRRWRVLPKKFWWCGRFWSWRERDAPLPKLGRKVLKSFIFGYKFSFKNLSFWPYNMFRFSFSFFLFARQHLNIILLWLNIRCGFVFSPGEIEGLKSQVEKTQVSVKLYSSNNRYMMYSLANILAYLLVALCQPSRCCSRTFSDESQ